MLVTLDILLTSTNNTCPTMENNKERHGVCYINKELVSLKVIYFTFFAAIGDLLPFIPVYMKHLGLSSTETGIIYGAMPFIAFFVRPVFGLIADKTHRHRLILIICCILTGVCYNLLLLTPTKEPPNNIFSIRTGVQCSPQSSFIQDCETQHDVGVRNLTDRHHCDHSLQSFYDQFVVNQTDVRCDLVCSLSFSSESNIEACFTNDVGPFQSDECGAIWEHSVVPNLKFSINDLDFIMNNKISGEDRTYLGNYCQNFDLKNVTFAHASFWQFICSVDLKMDCSVTCNIEGANGNCVAKYQTLSKTFWIFFIIFLFGNIFYSPITSLVDAIAYDILGENRGKWGMQRLWGTIAFIIFAITSTAIMDIRARLGNSVDYSISFYVFGVLCVATSVSAFFLKFDENLQCNQMFKDFRRLMKLPQVVFFLFMMLFYGMMNAVIEGFLFWYLNDLGSSQIVFGLCLVFNCVPEVILLFFSGKIINKIGHISCLYISAIGYSIRFFGYSFLTNPWYVLMVEPLHGFTFGLFYAAASSYVSIITPPGMSGTAQGLLGGIFFGLAKGVGSLITGKMFDQVNSLGPVWTFRFFGFFALFVFLLYFAVQMIFFRKAKLPLPEQKLEVEAETADALLEQHGEIKVNTEL